MTIIKTVKIIEIIKVEIMKVLTIALDLNTSLLQVHIITIEILNIKISIVDNIKMTTKKGNSVLIQKTYILINIIKIDMIEIMNQNMKNDHDLVPEIKSIIVINKLKIMVSKMKDIKEKTTIDNHIPHTTSIKSP